VRVDEKSHTRDIAAGTVETGNETEFDWIGADRKYDRHCCGCSFGGHCSRRGERNDCGQGVGDQLGGQCRQPVEATIGRAIFDREVAAFDIAGLLEALSDGADLSIIELGAEEQADQRDRRLLRTCRDRPRDRRAAEQRDECSPFHSITSSARASSVGGTSRPSAFAVLRLITSANSNI
jgi:hypothetical protein